MNSKFSGTRCLWVERIRLGGRIALTVGGSLLVCGIIACAFAAFPAEGAASAQSDAWERMMDEGGTRSNAGDFAAAAASYRAALNAAGAGGQPSRIAESVICLAVADYYLGRFADAKRDYWRALGLIERTAGKDNPDYALVLINFGSRWLENGDKHHAEAMLRESVSIYEPKSGSWPGLSAVETLDSARAF